MFGICFKSNWVKGSLLNLMTQNLIKVWKIIYSTSQLKKSLLLLQKELYSMQKLPLEARYHLIKQWKQDQIIKIVFLTWWLNLDSMTLHSQLMFPQCTPWYIYQKINGTLTGFYSDHLGKLSFVFLPMYVGGLGAAYLLQLYN